MISNCMEMGIASGRRMPNVPWEVPVANAMIQPITNIKKGSRAGVRKPRVISTMNLAVPNEPQTLPRQKAAIRTMDI